MDYEKTTRRPGGVRLVRCRRPFCTWAAGPCRRAGQLHKLDAAAAPPQPMGFFITSVGLGKGANLGGLAGADAHCQALATAAGAGNRTWRAYLSTTGAGDQPAVNARDRIGAGPWYNARGRSSQTTLQIFTAIVQRDRNTIIKDRRRSMRRAQA